jgi:type IV pilus assembly protein PilW
MRRIPGFSLVELMVALLLSAILISGALKLFGTVRAAYASAENIAALEERAAFALTALESDLRLAGFWGLHSNAGLIRVPSGIVTHCAGINVSAWALRLTRPVEAIDANTSLPCLSATRLVPGTDSLIVRHVSQRDTAPRSGRIQLHTNETAGELFSGETPPSIDGALTFDLQLHAWYLDRTSSEQDLPALRRYALVNDGLLQNQEIMPGVENFQVSLGVDYDGDHLIDSFVDTDNPGTAQVLAVRVWLLLRSARPEPGHLDNGPWYSIDADSSAALRPGDAYRRISVERTIWLRNQPPA